MAKFVTLPSSLYLAILCDLFVTVQWLFSRSSDLQLENFKATLHCLVYLNHICVCFRAWLLAVCVLVKVSQGSQNLGGLAVCAATVHCVTSLCQLLQHQRQAGLSCLTACPGASPKTRWRNLLLGSIRAAKSFVQVSVWRCNLETTDWIVVPGAWVPNPPNADGCTPVAFWGLGFGKIKALLRKPRQQHLLVGDPLNSVG